MAPLEEQRAMLWKILLQDTGPETKPQYQESLEICEGQRPLPYPADPILISLQEGMVERREH